VGDNTSSSDDYVAAGDARCEGGARRGRAGSGKTTSTSGRLDGHGVSGAAATRRRNALLVSWEVEERRLPVPPLRQQNVRCPDRLRSLRVDGRELPAFGPEVGKAFGVGLTVVFGFCSQLRILGFSAWVKPNKKRHETGYK